MIQEILIHGEYMYLVTDANGCLIAETYDLNEAEQILAQYRTRLQTRDLNNNLYQGVMPDPMR